MFVKFKEYDSKVEKLKQASVSLTSINQMLIYREKVIIIKL